MLPTVGEQRLHAQALTTWQRWAQGHDVANNAVRTALAVLAQRPGPEQQLAATLREDLAGTPIEQLPHHPRHLNIDPAQSRSPISASNSDHPSGPTHPDRSIRSGCMRGRPRSRGRRSGEWYEPSQIRSSAASATARRPHQSGEPSAAEMAPSGRTRITALRRCRRSSGSEDYPRVFPDTQPAHFAGYALSGLSAGAGIIGPVG